MTDLTNKMRAALSQFDEATKAATEVGRAVHAANEAIRKARQLGLIVTASYGTSTLVDYQGRETKIDAEFHAWCSVPL